LGNEHSDDERSEAPPGEVTDAMRRDAHRSGAFRPYHWLALLPTIGLLGGVPLANHVRPYVLGLPFLLVWIVSWVIATSVVLGVVLALDHAREGGAGGLPGGTPGHAAPNDADGPA
jgi:hypothetical protein